MPLSRTVRTRARSWPRLRIKPVVRHDAVGALLARELQILLDAVEGEFGGAAEDTENGFVARHVDSVVAPFAGGDLAAVHGEDGGEFLTVECSDVAGLMGAPGIGTLPGACRSRRELYGFDIAQGRLPVHKSDMIAQGRRRFARRALHEVILCAGAESAAKLTEISGPLRKEA